MNNTIEIIPHVFADALSKYLEQHTDEIIDLDLDYINSMPTIDVHQLRKFILLFITKHD